MMEIINKINQNPIFTLVLSILAIVGFVGWIAGIKRKRISIKITSNILIHDTKEPHEKLNILFDDQKIQNMTTTLITIWNSGNEVIKDSDTIKNFPWKIVATGDAKILEVKILKSTANGARIENTTDHEVEIRFDSFDKKDGVVFQVVHTGLDSDIVFLYRILGGEKNTYRIDEKQEIIHWKKYFKHAFVELYGDTVLSTIVAGGVLIFTSLLGLFTSIFYAPNLFFKMLDDYLQDNVSIYSYGEKILTDFVKYLTNDNMKENTLFLIMIGILGILGVFILILGIFTSKAMIPKELRQYASF